MSTLILLDMIDMIFFASTETPLVLTGKKKHPHLSNLATGTIPISGSVNEITTGGVSLYLVLTHIVTISSLLLFVCETSGFRHLRNFHQKWKLVSS